MKQLRFINKWLADTDIKSIIYLFLSWRILLLLFAVWGLLYLGHGNPDFFFGPDTKRYYENPLLWGWANFDGEHYLEIAKDGYFNLQHAFFPGYPLLIRFLAKPFGGGWENLIVSGFLIANLAFLAALFVFWKLVRLDYSKDVARYALFALVLFPTSFYFGAVYTESLFLLVVLLTFYFARKREYMKAGLFAAAASLIRIPGILLLPALAVEYQSQREEHKIKPSKHVLASLLLAPLGLFLYMGFLSNTTGDPFSFVRQQALFGEHRQGEFVLLYQVFWRYLKMIFTVAKDSPIYLTILMEAAAGIAGLGLILWGFLRRLRLSYLVFASLAYILPTFTGSFSSLPRFLIVLFPLFIILGIFLSQRGRVFRILYFAVSLALLALETILFFRGYWVA